MTQSRASANACSARRRSSSGKDAWDRNVGHPPLPQRGADLLDQLPGVAEHQPLLAPVQRSDHRCGVAHRPHVVQLDVPRAAASVQRRPPGSGRRHRRRAGPLQERRPQPHARPCPIPAASPAARPGCRRWPTGRSAGWAARHPGQSLQHRQQMPAAVVTGEGVHLVDDDRPQVGEQPAVLDLEADQHGFQRLRRGQQHVRRIAQDPLPRRRGCTSPCQSATRRPSHPA